MGAARRFLAVPTMQLRLPLREVLPLGVHTLVIDVGPRRGRRFGTAVPSGLVGRVCQDGQVLEGCFRVEYRR